MPPSYHLSYYLFSYLLPILLTIIYVSIYSILLYIIFYFIYYLFYHLLSIFNYYLPMSKKDFAAAATEIEVDNRIDKLGGVL